MKVRTINSPDIAVEEKIKLILKLYRSYQASDNRKIFAKDTWAAITKDPKHFYTLDIFFVIINESILRLDQDFYDFLKFLQKNKPLRNAISEIIIQDSTSEENHQVITEEQLCSTFNLNELGFLKQQLAADRKDAVEDLRDKFKKNGLRDFIKFCPLLFHEMKEESLKNLLLSNPVAVELLKDKIIIQRIISSTLLTEDDLLLLFAHVFPEEEREYFTKILLDFCHNYKPTFTKNLFVTINQQVATQGINSFHVDCIKENLASCKTYLLKFLEENPSLFLDYINSTAQLIDLLNKSPDPITYLNNLAAKEKNIGSWIEQNIVSITASLIKLNLPVQKINFFLNTRKAFPTLLPNAIRKALVEIGQTKIDVVNDAFVLMLNPNIKSQFTLSVNDLKTFSQNPKLHVFMDHLLTQDERLCQLFKDQLLDGMNRSAARKNFPLVFARLDAAKKLEVFDTISSFESSLTVLEAMLIASTTEWDLLYRYLNTKPFRGQVGHPIFKARIDYKPTNNKIVFAQKFIDYLLTADGFKLLISDSDYIEIIVTLGSGEQISQCLLLMNQYRNQKPPTLSSSEISRVIVQLNILQVNISSHYVLEKFIDGLNVDNIAKCCEIFTNKHLSRYLDCELLLKGILTLDRDERAKILSKIATKEIVFKIFSESGQKGYCALLINVLTEQNLIQSLFKALDEKELFALANKLSESVITHIFHPRFSQVVGELLQILQLNFLKITSYSLYKQLFKSKKFLSEVAAEMSLETFVNWLISDIGKQLTPLIIASGAFPILKVICNVDYTIKVICNNAVFGNEYFNQWNELGERSVLPEILIPRLLSENEEITRSYMNNNNFMSLLMNVMYALPIDVVTILRMRLGDVPRLSINEIVNRRKSLVNSRVAPAATNRRSVYIPLNLNQYKYLDLTGPKAGLLQNVHGKLYEDLKKGIDILIEHIENSQLELTNKYIPTNLLLHPVFFQYLQKLAENSDTKFLDYLFSLPRDLFEGYKDLIENPDTTAQLAFIKILHDIKSLIIHYLVHASKKYSDTTDVNFMKNFLFVLYLGCENFPNDVLNLCQRDTLFRKTVISFLQQEGIRKIPITFEGELLLRFLLLKVILPAHSNTSQQVQNIAHQFIQNFSCARITLSKKNASYIKRLFTNIDLLNIKNEKLIAHFLRVSLLSENFSTNNLLEFVSLFPTLVHSVFFYPHLLEKIVAKHAVQNFISVLKDLYANTDFSKMSLLVDAFAQTPVAAKPSEPSTSTFGKLRLPLEINGGAEHSIIVLSDEDAISANLEKNPQLSCLREDSVRQLVAQIMNVNPLRSHFEVVQRTLVYLLFDWHNKSFKTFIGNDQITLENIPNDIYRQTIQLSDFDNLIRTELDQVAELTVEDEDKIRAVTLLS